MKISIVPLVAALLGAGAGSAVAQQGPDAQPNVVTTTPSNGAMISPGRFLLRVTFDRPMLQGSYSFVRVSPDTYPDCDKRPMLSADGRTFTLRCTARAGGRYEVWFNRAAFMNFRSVEGVRAKQHRLTFSAKAP